MSFEPLKNQIAFVQPLEDKYRCIACKNILKEPVQSSCGHRLCTDCANAILKCPKPQCPDDGEELQADSLFKDRCAAREIQALQCYCAEKLHGCRWQGSMADLPTHRKDCPYEKVKCILGCNRTVLRCQLVKHVEKECEYREVECMHCFGQVPEIYLDRHLDKCPKCPIDCANGCGAKGILRDRMAEHQHIDCPLAVKFCTVHQLGCSFEGTEDQVQQHITDSHVEHLVLAGKSVEKSQNKVEELEQKTAIMEEKIRLLENWVEKQNDELCNATQTLSTQQVKLNKVEEFLTNHKTTLGDLIARLGVASKEKEATSLQDSVRELKKKIENQSEKLKSFQNEMAMKHLSSSVLGKDAPVLQRRVDAGDRTIAWHDVQIAQHDEHLKFLGAGSYDGAFVWIIDNYSQKFRDASLGKAASLFSTPFYTSRFGYKMCARIYLNGDGAGKGTHISLFVSVMKGEYDAILPWPFCKRITLKLLDQDRREDIIETFRPDPSSTSFNRPVSKMNVASGCPKFCPHTNLQTHGYMRENTMFVKVIIN